MIEYYIENFDFCEISAYRTQNEATMSHSKGIVTFVNKITASTFLIHYIPLPLNVGANIEVTFEAARVSGNGGGVGIDVSRTDNTDTINVARIDIGAHSDFRAYRLNWTVDAIRPSLQINFGMFWGQIGSASFRKIKVKITGSSLDLVKPYETMRPSYTRDFNLDFLNKNMSRNVYGSGTINEREGYIELKSPQNSKSYLLDAQSTSGADRKWRGININNDILGLMVEIKHKGMSGMPAFYIDCYNERGEAVDLVAHTIVPTETEGVARIWIRGSRILNKNPAYVSGLIGFIINKEGSLNLESMRISVYERYKTSDTMSNLCLIGGVIAREESKGWFLEDYKSEGSFNKPSSSMFERVSAESNELKLYFNKNGIKGLKPILSATIGTTGNQSSKYYAAIGDTYHQYISVFLINRDTGAIESPARVSGKCRIYCVGFYVK